MASSLQISKRHLLSENRASQTNRLVSKWLILCTRGWFGKWSLGWIAVYSPECVVYTLPHWRQSFLGHSLKLFYFSQEVSCLYFEKANDHSFEDNFIRGDRQRVWNIWGRKVNAYLKNGKKTNVAEISKKRKIKLRHKALEMSRSHSIISVHWWRTFPKTVRLCDWL